MIIKSQNVAHSHNLATYLVNASHNESSVISNQGGLITNLGEFPPEHLIHSAVNEMEYLSGGCKASKKYLHAIINPPGGRELTAQQWNHAFAVYHQAHGLPKDLPFIESTQRFNSRLHKHRMYLRVHNGKAVTMSFSHKKNEAIARILEFDFGEKPTFGKHNVYAMHFIRDKMARQDVYEWMREHKMDQIELPEAKMTTGEYEQQKRTKISIEVVEHDLTQAWQTTETGSGFQKAINKKGYDLGIGRKGGYTVRDSAGGIHSLRRRLFIDAKGKTLTQILNQKLSDLQLQDIKEVKAPMKDDINKNEPNKPTEQPDPENLKVEKQRLQRWNAKLKSIDREIEDRETSLARREELVLERDLYLQELQKEIEDDQFKLADNIAAWENTLSEREQLLVWAENNFQRRSEAISKQEMDYNYNEKELAKEKEEISALKKQLRQRVDGSTNPEPPPLNGKSIQHPVAELNALRGTKPKDDQNRDNKQISEKDSTSKQSSIERKTLASLKLRHNWDRQNLKHKVSQFKKKEPETSEEDNSPMRPFRKSAAKSDNNQTRTEDPVKPELNLEPPPIKRKKYHDILLLQGSTQKHVLGSLDQTRAGLDVSQFSKKSSKIINGYHDRVAAAAQEQVSNKIEEYRSRYYQQIEPLNTRYKNDLASLLTKQRDTYQDHLRSEKGILKRMGFGLRQAGVMRLLKYMTNRDFRQDYLERKFERERAALKRPFQKQVNKIEKQLKKELRAEVKTIRRQQDKENKQLPKIRSQVRQEEFKMSLNREHSQITKGRMPEQKTTVDMPDIPELTTPQPLVSEKSLNEISTLAKDAQAQFNSDKPANDHNTRADSIIAKINSVRNNSASKHKNVPEIHPSLK